MHIYDKNIKTIFFQGNSRPITTKLCMKHRSLKLIIFCSNDNPWLALNYFAARSNFATWSVIWDNVTMTNSLKIIASCDREFDLYSKLDD